MTVREMVGEIQRELRGEGEVTPDRAAVLQRQLASLLGNVSLEIRQADAAYAVVKVACRSTSKSAADAVMLAETTPEYQRRQEARDTKEMVKELIAACKYLQQTYREEMRLGGRP